MNQVNKVIKYLAIAFGLFLVFNIVSGIMYGFISIGNIFSDDEIGQLEQLDIRGDIDVLDIDVSVANIVIKESDTFKVETNNKHIKYSQNNNKLSITEKHNWFNKNSNLIIYVPTDLLFEDITIENGAGKVSIDILNAQRLNLDLGAGKVDINYLNVKNEAKIDGGAGQLSILNGEINNLDFDMGVGKTILKSKVTGNSEIDCGVGELSLNLFGKESDYQITVDKGLGSFKISGEDIVSGKTYGNGGYKLDIDGGVGSININFSDNSDNNELSEFKKYTRTYHLLNKTQAQEVNSYYLTLQVFQGEVDTVLVKNVEQNLEVGKTYEFNFERNDNNKINDSIDSIFENSKIIFIKETDKVGLEQIQDDIN